MLKKNCNVCEIIKQMNLSDKQIRDWCLDHPKRKKVSKKEKSENVKRLASQGVSLMFEPKRD